MCHPEVLSKANVVISNAKHDPHPLVLFQEPWIVDVRNVIHRIIEIKIVVMVAAHERSHIERPAHGDAGRCKIRVSQREVQRIVAAQTASGRRQLAVSVEVSNQWNDLVEKIVLVGDRAPNAVMRMDAAVVPAFAVNAIDAKELEMPRFNLPPNGMDHPGVLIFVELALGCWKYQHRYSGVPVGEKLHVPLEPMGEPVVVIPSHFRSDSPE